jgi:hypothetical protein
MALRQMATEPENGALLIMARPNRGRRGKGKGFYAVWRLIRGAILPLGWLKCIFS